MSKKKKTHDVIFSLVLIVLLVCSSAFLIMPRMTSNDTPSFNQGVITTNYKVLSLQQTNSSLIELGYGPSSLYPVDEQIPIYTTNDQLWIESNYNFSIYAELLSPQGQLLASVLLNPKTIAQMYVFNSTFPTSNLTLVVPYTQCCYYQPFSIPVQFVNPSSNEITSLGASYELSNGTLFASFSSPDLYRHFAMQACVSNASSSSEAEIPLPSSFGSGFIGVIGDPNTTSASLVLENTRPSGTFAFSFELFANYTFVLSTFPNQTSEYLSSELEVASSPSSTVITTYGPYSNVNMTFSSLASFRSGRYVLKAFFQNANGIQEVDTRVLITSPYANSWFWLGECQELDTASAPTFSVSANLATSPIQWPRYLYLMYQSVPGIEGFVNTSLGLNLNEVSFQANGNGGLPSDIQVSMNSNSAVESAEIAKGGDVYLITNGTYPISTWFVLSFGGKTFGVPNVVLESSYEQASYNVGLGELFITATQGSSKVINASVLIYSSSSGAFYSTLTNQFGVADVFVPPSNYTITVRNGNLVRNISQSVSSGTAYNIVASFEGQVNYGSYLIWVVSIITVIGAVGNVWFWFLGRRIRRFLHRS